MILLTMIGRLTDGLVLAASMQEDEKIVKSLNHYQSQAKQLFKRITSLSPSVCSLETDPYMFHYLIDRGVCCIILTEKEFSKKMAFAFLTDIMGEFHNEHGSKIGIVSRPYAFIEFDRYIQKAKKIYTDTRTSRNISQLNYELKDVQRIMVKNIDDVIQRGESLSVLDDKLSNISSLSKRYRQDASYLNLKSIYVKYVIVCIFLLILFSIIYFKFLW